MADAAAASCLVQVAHMQATNQAETSPARPARAAWPDLAIESAWASRWLWLLTDVGLSSGTRMLADGGN